jgi:hypothetical protein
MVVVDVPHLLIGPVHWRQSRFTGDHIDRFISMIDGVSHACQFEGSRQAADRAGSNNAKPLQEGIRYFRDSLLGQDRVDVGQVASSDIVFLVAATTAADEERSCAQKYQFDSAGSFAGRHVLPL